MLGDHYYAGKPIAIAVYCFKSILPEINGVRSTELKHLL